MMAYVTSWMFVISNNKQKVSCYSILKPEVQYSVKSLSKTFLPFQPTTMM